MLLPRLPPPPVRRRGRPHEPPRFVLPLPSVAAALLPVDDDRYVPSLPELHPQQTVREARAMFDDVAGAARAGLLPADGGPPGRARRGPLYIIGCASSASAPHVRVGLAPRAARAAASTATGGAAAPRAAARPKEREP